ncbi:16999_t:CDS:2 [Racocetra fulgida]|uniref:16999_t:CDS:1 n=1 Tax=Racocetra fulgida TaxID=60492 RepID=A0A9N8W8K1_9GLOM|nr:16999_t:CDS:2 [Racocetra fulgida]
MLEFINFYVTYKTTDALNIGKLLRDRYLGWKIYQKNVYNAIHYAKKKLSYGNELDTSNLLLYLYNLKTNDPRWFIEARFDAGANSTQHVEGFNKKIHNGTKANSSLITFVKEIQDILDKEAEFARVKEYKHQIPTVGLATIPKTFFKSLYNIVEEYLTDSMSVYICKQMQNCFFYDAYKLDHKD